MIIFAFKKFIQIDCICWGARKDLSGTVRGIFQVRYDGSLDWDGNTGNGEKGKNVRVIQKVKLVRPDDWLNGAKVGEKEKCQG